ncbi:MAG: N-6 DNA methylase [Candidatus Lokiarchaeota archaeon]|nr:N-6 DNA methylase [Candidatus Lokiarchaeota archaeon]MBD3200646.1 N-6 DNA methylase [Candidatus Lokiarchaeota archaeon]
MSKAKISADAISLFTKEISNIQDSIQNCLKKDGFFDQKLFRIWEKKYSNIYGKEVINSDLYIRLAILYHFGYTLLFYFKITNSDDIKKYNQFENYEFSQIQKAIKTKITFYNSISIDYFEIFNKILEPNLLGKIINSQFRIINSLKEYKIPKEYIIDSLIQGLIPAVIRHNTGEYYTPPFLTKKMINSSYSFGEKILDPCCGSGNFLIETINTILASDRSKKDKFKAINNVYGFDINPLSTFMAKINFLLILRENSNQIKINIYEMDSLFQKRNDRDNLFDLIIGNPPWYTLRDINSSKEQNKIKLLADKLNIKPLPKNVLNIEISSIFFYQMKKRYMKEGARIFFVLPKGVMNGSHSARFRNFSGFDNIKIWQFDKTLKKTFNIDFICVYAQKTKKKRNIEKRISIPSLIFGNENISEHNYFDLINLKIIHETNLVPFDREKRGNKTYTKKLITEQDYKSLISPSESYYKTSFHKGADLNPRNLIFVETQAIDHSLVRITPDPRVFKRAKKPWNEREFESGVIERDYVYRVVKSTELVKFYIFDDYQVFLPVKKSDLNFSSQTLQKRAKEFYNMINQIYLSKKKSTTQNKSLMDNLNRWNKLSNARQLSEIKVVYNNSGTVLNAAVLQKNCLVTGDLSYLATDNLQEAYYLSAILNSPTITSQIKIMKSSRHIFKLPLNLPIKKFDPLNERHNKLSSLGLKAEEKSIELSKDIISRRKNTSVSPKYKIQKILKKSLTDIFNEIDALVDVELNN